MYSASLGSNRHSRSLSADVKWCTSPDSDFDDDGSHTEDSE